MSQPALTPNQQQQAISYIQSWLAQLLTALSILNDPNASTKYSSTYLQQQEALVQTMTQNAMNLGMWLAAKNQMTLTAWTDSQVQENTSILS